MREELKRQVETCIDRCSGELTELADTIWNNPEYNFKEYKACRSITGLLENHGFEVERGTGGIETAFHAFCDSGNRDLILRSWRSTTLCREWATRAAII